MRAFRVNRSEAAIHRERHRGIYQQLNQHRSDCDDAFGVGQRVDRSAGQVPCRPSPTTSATTTC